MANLGNLSFENATGLSSYKSDEDLAAVILFNDYSDKLLQFGWISCIVFMLIGIPGNLFTIIALAKFKKVRNATALFIINLSLSDLMFCCFILPLAASTFWHRSWRHGKVLCLMFPYARYALVAVSLFSVLSITINRYIMISHPRFYSRIYKTRNLYFMIAGIWAFPILSLLPTCLEIWGRFSLDVNTGSCTIIADENHNTPKQILFIIAFMLPTIAIFLCYARVWWIVRKTTKQSKKQTHKPIVEMKSLNMSTATIATKSMDLDQKPSRHTISQFPFNCFLQTGAELSFSSDSGTPDDKSRHSIHEDTVQSIYNQPKNFRRSFIATMKWTTVAVPKPRLPTKKDKKLLTMIMAIMVSFCVCHLPITLTKTAFLDYNGHTSHPVSNIIGYVLIYFTTCVNPVIYVVLSSEYRQAYKNLMKCR